MTLLFERAVVFGTVAHKGQVRKYTNEPYITHPLAVAEILRTVGYIVDEEVLAAAVLHDTIEDCDVTWRQIEIITNTRVAELVMQCTDASINVRLPDGKWPKEWNRKKRKELDRMHMSHSDYAGASIKLADFIHNTKSIAEHDKGFAKIYMVEKMACLEVLKHGNELLWNMAHAQVQSYGSSDLVHKPEPMTEQELVEGLRSAGYCK